MNGTVICLSPVFCDLTLHSCRKTAAESSHDVCQALVYDIPPPKTVIIDYAIGLDILSANGQFLFGAQMAVNL